MTASTLRYRKGRFYDVGAAPASGYIGLFTSSGQCYASRFSLAGDEEQIYPNWSVSFNLNSFGVAQVIQSDSGGNVGNPTIGYTDRTSFDGGATPYTWEVRDLENGSTYTLDLTGGIGGGYGACYPFWVDPYWYWARYVISSTTDACTLHRADADLTGVTQISTITPTTGIEAITVGGTVCDGTHLYLDQGGLLTTFVRLPLDGSLPSQGVALSGHPASLAVPQCAGGGVGLLWAISSGFKSLWKLDGTTFSDMWTGSGYPTYEVGTAAFRAGGTRVVASWKFGTGSQGDYIEHDYPAPGTAPSASSISSMTAVSPGTSPAIILPYDA